MQISLKNNAYYANTLIFVSFAVFSSHPNPTIATTATPESITTTSPVVEPEASETPEPVPDNTEANINEGSVATPTRIDSEQQLKGERFPETRMREMRPDEVSEMSNDNLRYAINEMYARYGMTFKDTGLQSKFNERDWYQPVDKWTPEQIEKAFTSIERKNLATLISERGSRQNDG